MRRFVAGVALALTICPAAATSAPSAASRSRDEWIALATAGFRRPDGARAIDVLPMALALHSAVRREDADAAALEQLIASWVNQGKGPALVIPFALRPWLVLASGRTAFQYETLWAKGPQVDPRLFAQVENGRQIMRSVVTALAAEASPTSAGDSARRALPGGVAKMR
jgi:hypothetical protein